ncbi:XRE family transcriptional regulator [Phocoenobacter skyensis]|uniref:Phage repressor protein C, contains Cro/C1-type HTH and peptisase s24 domains n=1 Tax=Phocoenobacter skyensis TaxID=97481 RepID=A0A1H7XMA1_9PAST|nr:XRE family transcriptional regulator [Pasteurella skyensis]MDP8184375.1 S24 family peptidase [Pasteurella skyensis]QLB22620.1 repressor [Pasteurella skyensis]SEM34317.1 Phage repressor protein C, contains Cro/C1-type HTH and peptisase s24 domains [Pasteurella skyensis]
MKELGDRIEYALELRNTDRAFLAKKLNRTRAAIGNLINGKVKKVPIYEIAEALHIDPDWLLTGKGEPGSYALTNISTQQDTDHSYKIDLLDVQAATNHTGIINNQYPEVIQSIYFSKDGMLEIVGRKSNQGLALITIPSDSMSPTIEKGDIVFVDTTINYYQGEGIYIFLTNDETFIKRLQRVPSGTYKALSDNQYYAPFELTPDEFEQVRVIGKFVRVLPIDPRDL